MFRSHFVWLARAHPRTGQSLHHWFLRKFWWAGDTPTWFFYLFVVESSGWPPDRACISGVPQPLAFIHQAIFKFAPLKRK